MDFRNLESALEGVKCDLKTVEVEDEMFETDIMKFIAIGNHKA